jgi:hypothetical protein
MAHNVVHLARMLKAAGGIPAEGNTVPGWQRARVESRDGRMPTSHVGEGARRRAAPARHDAGASVGWEARVPPDEPFDLPRVLYA